MGMEKKATVSEGQGQRGRWRSFLAALREAYRSGGAPALAEVWAEGRTSRRVGLSVRGIELFYPVGGVLSIAAELDGRIRDEGFSNASRWVLDRWVPGWKAVVPPQAAEVLSSAPVLVYGNHPSNLLTLFLVAASVPRSDLRVVSAAFLERLLPSYSPYALSVVLPVGSFAKAFWARGLPNALVRALLRSLEPSVPREKAKGANRKAILGAADHLRSGGAVVIAPGGGNSRLGSWQPGIGRILHTLSRDPGPVPEYLVPYHDDNSSDARIRLSLGQGPVASLGRRFYRRPVTIRYGLPTLRSALGKLPEDPAATARLLQRRYVEIFRS